jgi:hypothetical protein
MRTTRSALSCPARSRSCSIPGTHQRAQTWDDDPAAYADSLSTREPVSLVPGLNFDDQVPPAGIHANHRRRGWGVWWLLAVS